MDDWVTVIDQIDAWEIHDVLVLLVDRYHELFPYGQMVTYWVDYGENVYEQIDNQIARLERLKKQIGPVLTGSSGRVAFDRQIPTAGYRLSENDHKQENRKKNTAKIIPWKNKQ